MVEFSSEFNLRISEFAESIFVGPERPVGVKKVVALQDDTMSKGFQTAVLDIDRLGLEDTSNLVYRVKPGTLQVGQEVEISVRQMDGGFGKLFTRIIKAGKWDRLLKWQVAIRPYIQGEYGKSARGLAGERNDMFSSNNMSPEGCSGFYRMFIQEKPKP